MSLIGLIEISQIFLNSLEILIILAIAVLAIISIFRNENKKIPALLLLFSGSLLLTKLIDVLFYLMRYGHIYNEIIYFLRLVTSFLTFFGYACILVIAIMLIRKQTAL